jgi:cytochrome c peroxidase
MKRTRTGMLALLLLAGSCGESDPPPEPQAPPPEVAAPEAAGPDRAAVLERARPLFGVLPLEASSEANPVTEAKIELGRLLYFDPRLSRNQEISCNSCHDLASFGVDGRPTSPGHGGQLGQRNSPTVYNAAFQIAQFWDGRAADVEEQAKGPILNPVEMAMRSEADVLAVLRSIPDYEPLFRAAFPAEEDPVTYDNVARAIGAFERRLVTPGRFDAFLRGETGALRDREVEGFAVFMEAGCTTCHMGPGVGGDRFQKLGVVKDYPLSDAGRFEVTGAESDRFVFKVPSLRNVAETGPYFHDGSVPSLEDAIRTMAEYQLGRSLEAEELASIEAFLRSLTGNVNAAYVAPPELPRSGPDTPPPDAS